MNTRERIARTLSFQDVDDRLPLVELFPWWDKTLARWESEGLYVPVDPDGLKERFGLDMVRQFLFEGGSASCPDTGYSPHVVQDMRSYMTVRDHLLRRESLGDTLSRMSGLRELHEKGDLAIWITLEGFFWFPRSLFGPENHLCAFYEHRDVLHRIHQDLVQFHIYIIEECCRIIQPDFMTFAEDMSYNHGSMISYDIFKEFFLPYYKQVVPVLRKHGIIPLVDSDGLVDSMIPWFIEAGFAGVLPLERQAGVDVVAMRRNYPDLRIIGGFDKMAMGQGERRVRAEFDRLLPVMKSGGYIACCDHQTPPDVSLSDYALYLKVMREYCERAVRR
jgi:hypothetical protein